MIAAFDCDGPLIQDRVGEFFRFVNEHYGYGWSYEQYVQIGDWRQATGGQGYDQVSALYFEFRKNPEFAERPVPGAREAINGPLAAWRRYLATTRSPALSELTRNFLRANIGHFHGHHFGLTDKAGVLLQRGVVLYAEDSYHEARLAAKLDITVLLFPVRGFPRPNANGSPKLIVPEADRRNQPGISDADWEDVCRSYWQEFIEISQRCH